MTDLFILRLYPEKPTDGPSFTAYLTGLTISVSDMSFQNPEGVSNVVGTAFYDPANPASTIVQHLMPSPPPFLLAAVATAAIVINPAKEPPAYAEYGTSDLRLTITRGTQTIVDRSLNYNVDVDAGGTIPAGHNPLLYATLAPVALYLALPSSGVGVGPGQAFVNVPTDGSPPNYDQLLVAVNNVLAKDPQAGNFDITALTAAQCRHIASEITWNRQLNPLPKPAEPLEDLYTLPNASSSSVESDRRQFEADLIGYSTTNGTQSEALAKYIFALSAALASEAMSDNAAHAGLTTPVLPGIVDSDGRIQETDVILS